MGQIRAFDTGATRNSDAGKNDYEGFISPAVLRAYGDYMTENRVMADGSTRDSDNWQKGIPRVAYVKSLLRHVLDLWLLWRGFTVKPDVRNGKEIPWTYERLCCAIMFNVMGFLHETLKAPVPELVRSNTVGEHLDDTAPARQLHDLISAYGKPAKPALKPMAIQHYPASDEWRCTSLSPIEEVSLCYAPLEHTGPCPRCGGTERKLVATGQHVGFVPEVKMGPKKEGQ